MTTEARVITNLFNQLKDARQAVKTAEDSGGQEKIVRTRRRPERA
ncbi:MAG: hypothetical protein PF690_13820 [Deltaproteobacteria bacterium]|jgi:hypothetical protein|nr:hypothetical protein [Deltaproteobacteria bacterium]